MNLHTEDIYKLIKQTSTELPDDVHKTLKSAVSAEKNGSNAYIALKTMLDNAALAKNKIGPICQDTGTIMFWVKAPEGASLNQFRKNTVQAVRRATADGLLRQNCVDSLTGKNTGDNIGKGSPVIHWDEHENGEDNYSVTLILKGGGCENVGAQYSLPDTRLGAGRNLEGVRKCVLDAAFQAQGKGCAPGIFGVCIGGDRATSYEESKHVLTRKIGERSSNPELADMETKLTEEINTLGIGPMGFGGKTTALDVFISDLHRLPASYFVSVSYMCWAFRRGTATIPLQKK